MTNELYVADIEMRLRSAEANYLLKVFRDTRNAGTPATVAMLSREIMKGYGKHLVVMEQCGPSEYKFLYAGDEVPDDGGEPIVQKSTSEIQPGTAAMYRMGCDEARAANDPVCISHQTGMIASVHLWECLFLPLDGDQANPMYVVLSIPREMKHNYQRLLLDALPVGILRASPVRDSLGEIVDATIRSGNPQAAEFTGHDNITAILGTSLFKVFGDTHSSSGWDKHLTALRTGKPQIFEYHNRNEARSLWLQVQSVPIRDGVVVVLIDVTETKQAYLELEHHKKMLIDEMEQRRNLEQELWALAHLDPLTGLPNRRAFRDAALLKLAEAQTAHRSCAIITIDIDHFKRVNDAFGHGAGDTVLRRIADIIKAPLRPNLDISARMGGEEFTVLLPDTDADTAAAFAEKLRRRVEQTVVAVGEHEIRPTISLGVALNRQSSDLDDLIDRADRALYTAKRTGRNKVAIEGGIPAPTKTEAAKPVDVKIEAA